MPDKVALYGVVQSSLVTFYNMLKPLAKLEKLTVRVVDKDLPEADILLFPNFKTFKRLLPEVKNKRVTAILFDSPLQLMEIKEIRFLDLQDKPDISHTFYFRPINKRMIKKLLVEAKNPPKLKINVKAFDIMPLLLQMVQTGKFLDKFSALIYNAIGITTRNSIRLVITNYLFQGGRLEDLTKKLNKYFKSGLGADYVKEVLTYLGTTEGENLCKACLHIHQLRSKLNKNNKKKPVPYKKVAKTFGVDHYELKYLNKWHRNSMKEDKWIPTKIERISKIDPIKKS